MIKHLFIIAGLMESSIYSVLGYRPEIVLPGTLLLFVGDLYPS